MRVDAELRHERIHALIISDVNQQPFPESSIEPKAEPRVELVAEVVILPSPAGIGGSLSYRVPGRLREQVQIGSPVLVPLVGRDQLGYVLAVGPLTSTPDYRLVDLREVLSPEPSFGPVTVELARHLAAEYRCNLSDAVPLWVPERYGATLMPTVSLGAWDGAPPERVGLHSQQAFLALFAALTAAGGTMTRAELESKVQEPMLPAALRRARKEGWVTEERALKPPKVRARTLRAVRLGAVSPDPTDRLGPRQKELLERLAAEPEGTLLLAEAEEQIPGARAAAEALARRGWVEVVDQGVRRAPRISGHGDGGAPILNQRQVEAVSAIDEAAARGKGESLLLWGVTGSGKTEVYLHCIQRAREEGRTAILLVPEISLTAQVAAVVRRRLGERVAILHSALSEGERFDEWERLRRGEADVVVGPRSALFAPLRDPALVILDEEHDNSYKQDRQPRYHAREVAVELARRSGGCVVLGSATPSLESFHAASSEPGHLLPLPERAQRQPMPTVEVVDFRRESSPRAPGGGIFTNRLAEALLERAARGEQSILFLNRRGWSSFLLCRDCGHVPKCPSCDVSLTLHRIRDGYLLCHHCGHLRRAPTTCEHCLGSRVRHFGLGTQRVEDAVRELLPGVRVARLDRDTVSGKDGHSRILDAVREREVDVLVGTQMVTKGFDFPHVTLVGVVAADVALHVPDFRASERAFQLLTQVAGRAGRGDRPGEVVIQTFSPEHPSIVAASTHDYMKFYKREIRAREELGYPPFGSLARLLSQQPTSDEAEARLKTAAEIIHRSPSSRHVRILGPAACPLGRIQDRYRWHLLLKASTRAAIRAVLDEAWPLVQSRVGGLSIDVEPYDLM